MHRFVIVILCLATLAALYSVFPHQPLPPGTKIDKIEVFKSQREMLVYSQGKRVKTYPISLGGQPTGFKQCQGDQKTPEGEYKIEDKNPNSICYKNLGISYPTSKDLNNKEGQCQDKGGDIKIHFSPISFLTFRFIRGHKPSDWMQTQ